MGPGVFSSWYTSFSDGPGPLYSERRSMAIKAAVRWKPDIGRTSLETTIQNFAPSSVPPAGNIVRTAQLVGYDDTVVTGANYAAGDPQTERRLIVLYETPITLDLAGFASLTAAQARALWDSALTDFGTTVRPAAPTLVIAQLGAMQSAPVVLS